MENIYFCIGKILVNNARRYIQIINVDDDDGGGKSVVCVRQENYIIIVWEMEKEMSATVLKWIQFGWI